MRELKLEVIMILRNPVNEQIGIGRNLIYLDVRWNVLEEDHGGFLQQRYGGVKNDTGHEDAECGIDVQSPRVMSAEIDDDCSNDNNDGTQRIAKNVEVYTLHVEMAFTFFVVHVV